jgi:putative protease
MKGIGPARPELIAPAGDMERLKTALHFGADAVYLSGKQFSLRTFSKNFTLAELAEAVPYVHARGKRAYLAVNSFVRNEDLSPLRSFLRAVSGLGFDAVILSDPAVLELCRDIIPEAPLHLSTQANTTNVLSARHWFSQGIRRIILARELSLEEIRQIKRQAEGEIEVFVHGALCIAYSGRCLLSLYLADRDANRGSCAQTCRWRFALVEDKRPGMYLPIEEDDRGSYILNSKDLCLLGLLPDLIESGVDALKIEGRRKGIHYLAAVIKAYRWAMDRYMEDPAGYRLPPSCWEEIHRVSNRAYTTGFLNGRAEAPLCLDEERRVQQSTLAGVIRGNGQENWVSIEVRAKIRVGDTLEHMGPSFPNPVFALCSMRAADQRECLEAHEGDRVWVRMPAGAEAGDLLRKRIDV